MASTVMGGNDRLLNGKLRRRPVAHCTKTATQDIEI